MIDSIKNKLLLKQIINKVGTFYFYDNFMISEIEEIQPSILKPKNSYLILLVSL